VERSEDLATTLLAEIDELSDEEARTVLDQETAR